MVSDTHTRGDLAALLARVEGAEGPDRELDGAIYILFFGSGEAVSAPEGKVLADTWSTPAFTASLDAALALCERVLPGWFADIIQLRAGQFEACVNGVDDFERYAVAPARALALLAATLRALIAQQETQV